ncbi:MULTISPECIES: hypothetical protein [Vibrio]|uniref:hypothetical protein n=1 Tax=Vibrio TaxID=662 RepID=UPI001CDCB280|nr:MULTISPECIES: hypothetical protein [Vibrio]MCA2487217.1 hypothetical protein [Vibrio alginolyticus]MDW1779951.1 hypothetical protein [Vibrio sp. Vb2134]MDW2084319.1 hypothetical protein [Vibrio sp. 2134-1]
MARQLHKFTNTIAWKLDRPSWNKVLKDSKKLARQLDRANPENVLGVGGSPRARRQRQQDQDSHIKHYRKLQLEQEKFEATQKKVLLRFAQSTSAIRDMGVAEKKVLLNKLKQASSTEELLHLEKRLKNQISDRNRREKQRTRELAKQSALITHQHNERRKAAASSLKRAGMAAGVVGAGLATVGMQQSLQRATELDQAIKKSNLDSETFQNLAAASSRFGLSMDQVASNYQDFADRLGEFRLTGSGEFKDIAEWLQQNSKITTKMLESLEPLEVMHLLQKEAERRGTDMRDLTFLMESFSSEAINQFKAMNNLAEIQAQRERFNLNLTQQDIDTLVKARQNITLMGEGFLRLADSFLVGFGGGDINNVMTNLKELQPTFRSLGESVRSFVDTTTEHGDQIITIAKTLASIWVGSKIFTVLSGGLSVVNTLTNVFKGLFKLIGRAAGTLGFGGATKAAGSLGGSVGRAAAGIGARANPYLAGALAVYEGRPGGLLDPANFFGDNKYTKFLNTNIFDLLGRAGKEISSIQTQHQKVDVNLHVRSDVDNSGNIIPVVRGEIDRAEDDRMVAFYSNLSPSN